MTAFYTLTDGRLMAVTEHIEAGPAKLLKGYVQGLRHPTVVRADQAKPLPGAPMAKLHLVAQDD